MLIHVFCWPCFWCFCSGPPKFLTEANKNGSGRWFHDKYDELYGMYIPNSSWRPQKSQQWSFLLHHAWEKELSDVLAEATSTSMGCQLVDPVNLNFSRPQSPLIGVSSKPTYLGVPTLFGVNSTVPRLCLAATMGQLMIMIYHGEWWFL
jgi:hypothetical protein